MTVAGAGEHSPGADIGISRDVGAVALGAGRASALRLQAACAIDAAARSWSFFYAANHGVDRGLMDRTVALARAFFAKDESTR